MLRIWESSLGWDWETSVDWDSPQLSAMGFPQACLPELGGKAPLCPLPRFQPMGCCDFFFRVEQEVVVPRV